MSTRFAATTHRGLVRERNEDNYLVVKLTQPSSAREGISIAVAGVSDSSEVLLLLVADGMGGHARGDLASQIVVDHFARLAKLDCSPLIVASGSAPAIEATLRRELKHCHAAITRRSQSAELRGMGSTATVAVVAWPKLFVAHVGDSRCYLLSKGEAQQVTRDHSLAQYFVEQGSASLGSKSPFRHKLWNCLGGDCRDVTVDFHEIDLHGNDALLLCTDGLTNSLTDLQLVEHFRNCDGAAETCGSLVAAANAAGGRDNITCCAVRFARREHPLCAAGVLPTERR